MPSDSQKISRYRQRSVHLLHSAINEMRSGHWSRSEDLLWGSLTLAVKGVALNRGEDLDSDAAVQQYASQLGQTLRDRRIREAFPQLASFGDAVERLRESRSRVDRLVPMLEDVTSAIERLWEMVPRDNIEDDVD